MNKKRIWFCCLWKYFM